MRPISRAATTSSWESTRSVRSLYSPKKVFEFDEEEEGRQLAHLEEVRRTRSNSDVDSALSEIRRSVEADANIFPHVLDAVRSSATEGEIMGTLRDSYGEYVDPGVF